jgi:hypothetical protein
MKEKITRKQFVEDYKKEAKTNDIKIILADGTRLDLSVESLKKLEKIAKKVS